MQAGSEISPIDEKERPNFDPAVEEVTEGEETEDIEKLKTKWAQLEVLVGTEKRLSLIAEDLVRHFEQRLEVMDGKAMIVCMSRRICVGLYDALVKLRPDWHDTEDDKGLIKVVMTGSASDPLDWQQHVRGHTGSDTKITTKPADDQPHPSRNKFTLFSF